jgi:hypothetical protein
VVHIEFEKKIIFILHSISLYIRNKIRRFFKAIHRKKNVLNIQNYIINEYNDEETDVTLVNNNFCLGIVLVYIHDSINNLISGCSSRSDRPLFRRGKAEYGDVENELKNE